MAGVATARDAAELHDFAKQLRSLPKTNEKFQQLFRLLCDFRSLR
jgi:hypothetical protein